MEIEKIKIEALCIISGLENYMQSEGCEECDRDWAVEQIVDLINQEKQRIKEEAIEASFQNEFGDEYIDMKLLLAILEK